MRSWTLLAVLMATSWLGPVGPPPVAADLLQDLGATYQQAAEELVKAFPKFEGQITALDGDMVTLSGPAVDKLRPGLELSVFRKGERFRYPITNQPLGRSEIDVGTVAVVEVTPGSARARILERPAGQEVAVDDGVRLTAGRIPVAVLATEGVPVSFDSADQTALLLVTRFSAILEKTARFHAADPQRVLALRRQGQAHQALSPLEAARELHTPAVLSSRVVLENRARMLEATWWSGISGNRLVSLRIPVARASYPPRFVWEQTPELQRRLVLAGAVRGMALADVDGDGRSELVVADEDSVTLYRWEEGGSLVELAGGTFRPGGVVLAVDAADLTGRGRAEIVLTSYGGTGRDSVRSRVLAWEDGTLRPLYDTSRRFLRVVAAGGKRWLVEQDAGEPEPFTGSIRRILWRDGRFSDGPTIPVPRGVSIYGLALLRLTGGPDFDVVAVTPEDRLVVWTAKGQRLWTSPEPYGGSTVAFPYYVEGRNQAAENATIGRIPARIIDLAEGGGGGEAEILVYENVLPALEQVRTLLPRLTPIAFTGGRIHRLRWTDGGFLRVWQSAATAGYIADFTYGDLDGDTIPEVVVGVMPRGLNLDTLNPFGGSRGQVVFYELP